MRSSSRKSIWRRKCNRGSNGETERLGKADDGGLLGRSTVGMDNSDATKGSHGSSHVGFGDSVHRRSNAGDREADVAGEVGGQRHGIGREVNVVREKYTIVVGIRVALAEQL